MEGAGRDEQDVIGLHRSVLGRHRRALDERQQVALHAFAADAGPDAALPRGDLVDLVDEDDAVVLRRRQRALHDLVLVEQLVGLVVDEMAVGFLDGRLAHLGAPAHRLRQHLVDVEHTDVGAGHARQLEAAGRGVGDLHLDLLVVHLARAQLLAETVAGRGARRLAH